MTQSINVTVGREVFEITIHVEDEHGRVLPLANNFFRNPNLFQSCTRDLLSKLSDRGNITQIDTTGISYGSNLQAHTDSTRPLWERVELYVRGRVGAAMVDAEDDELNLSEIDDASDAGSDATEEDFSTVPRATPPSLSGRTAPISLTPPVLHSQAPQTHASHTHNDTIPHTNLGQGPVLEDLNTDDEELSELSILTQTAGKISQLKPRITVRQVTADRGLDEERTTLLTKLEATVQEDLRTMLDYFFIAFPGSSGH